MSYEDEISKIVREMTDEQVHGLKMKYARMTHELCNRAVLTPDAITRHTRVYLVKNVSEILVAFDPTVHGQDNAENLYEYMCGEISLAQFTGDDTSYVDVSAYSDVCNRIYDYPKNYKLFGADGHLTLDGTLTRLKDLGYSIYGVPHANEEWR